MNGQIGDLVRMVEVHLGARSVTATDRLVEDLEAESMDLVNLVAEVEDHFNVVFADGDLVGVSTVQDLWDLVQRSTGP